MKQKIIIAILVIAVINNAIAQNADVVNTAINEGDCETLYRIINNPQGIDQRLLTTASQALRRYTVNDATGARYRTNRMDSKVRSITGALMENVFIDPARYLPEVVSRLISGVSDPLQRVKNINDWICDNISYDTETYFGNANRRQDYISVLNSKLAVCAGYSILFYEMCRLASVECIVISGFSKGFGYTGRIGSSPDHAWNAVRAGNKWYLVDVTWNAGYLEYRSFIKHYSTDYLFLDSRSFLYSHLPLENKHQFFAPIVTREQFMDEPYIAGVFFKYQLAIKDNLLKYKNSVDDGGFILEIINNNNTVQLASAVRTTGQDDIIGAEWQEKSGNTILFKFDVPDSRDYTGLVFARFTNERKAVSSIYADEYEYEILPKLDELLSDRKITEREKEYFINSYYKIQENYYYYFIEDQFDTARNNAVLKIHPLVNLSFEWLEPVLNFDLKASGAYSGYSRNYSVRFPRTYRDFLEASNTRLVTPIKGNLIAGTSETFTIISRDYTGFFIYASGRRTSFTRGSNNSFELVYEVPDNVSELILFGVRGNNSTGLISYIVE
ncbi:MAG: hypothetical protein FWC21_03655 [Treponema sp.]|nr:hypothetical protein [Treponema sp.]